MLSPIEQFRNALARRSIVPPAEIIADGRIHRCDAEGKHGKDDASYLLHLNGFPAGGFENWRDGLGWEIWRADIAQPLSTVEREAQRKCEMAARAEREADAVERRARARERAGEIWQAARLAPADHPYLLAKGVSGDGLRVHKEALVVPLRDAAGELCSLQFIGAEGGKFFLTGGQVRGCYFAIGKPNGALCIAEGYATGASIHAATGHAVAVAFHAGNLEPVALGLRAKFPDLPLILCADDDAATQGNPGMTKATEAARAAGALLAIPEFGDGRPEAATDFNDMAALHGLEAVKRAIDNAKVPDKGKDQWSEANATSSDSAGSEWPNPKPIIAELKPVPAFDADTLLPDVLRAWITDEAERMPCAADFIAAAAIVALGSIIGARCAIKPKARDAWLIVPNLWGGIVGDPSAKKSPAWSVALTPLDRLSAKALNAHQEALNEYETTQVVFEAQRDAIEARIKEAAKKPGKGDPAAIARELRAHEQQAPPVPTLRRYKTNDCTVEKLGELLRENPAGLLVLRDELVGLMASWEREGREGERAFFLEAWNGNQAFDTDRIGRGHVAIPNVCVSIFGGIQPDKLTVYLEQAAQALSNDGMLQRFQLLVYPDPRRWEWRDRAPNKAARDAAFAVFETLADFDPMAWGAASADELAKFPYFRFDEAAQTIFIEWSEDLHGKRMLSEDEPIMRQHLAKFDKLFPALALIFHLVECAEKRICDPISKEAALRAAAWCEYLEAHARRCYGLLKDDGLRAAQALASKLERGALEDGFTLRDVRRNQWRHLTTDAAIQAAVDWLEDEDWLKSESIGGTGPGSGRRTVCYRINPAIISKRNAHRI